MLTYEVRPGYSINYAAREAIQLSVREGGEIVSFTFNDTLLRVGPYSEVDDVVHHYNLIREQRDMQRNGNSVPVIYRRRGMTLRRNLDFNIPEGGGPIEFLPRVTCSIEQAARNAIEIAHENSRIVTFEFNGQNFRVNRFTGVDDIVSEYFSHLNVTVPERIEMGRPLNKPEFLEQQENSGAPDLAGLPERRFEL